MFSGKRDKKRLADVNWEQLVKRLQEMVHRSAIDSANREVATGEVRPTLEMIRKETDDEV